MLSINSMEELNKVLKENEKVVIDLWAPWCGPCRVLGPVFEKASEIMEGVLFAKVNVDDASDIAQNFNILSIPTVIYFKNEKQVGKSVGVPSSLEAFKETVEKHLS